MSRSAFLSGDPEVPCLVACYELSRLKRRLTMTQGITTMQGPTIGIDLARQTGPQVHELLSRVYAAKNRPRNCATPSGAYRCSRAEDYPPPEARHCVTLQRGRGPLPVCLPRHNGMEIHRPSCALHFVLAPLSLLVFVGLPQAAPAQQPGDLSLGLGGLEV